jgi:hypothetical protein
MEGDKIVDVITTNCPFQLMIASAYNDALDKLSHAADVQQKDVPDKAVASVCPHFRFINQKRDLLPEDKIDGKICKAIADYAKAKNKENCKKRTTTTPVASTPSELCIIDSQSSHFVTTTERTVVKVICQGGKMPVPPASGGTPLA